MAYATTLSDPYVKNEDILVCDAMEFFNSKSYNMDVADIIIQVCTYVLALDISIYMNEGGHLKIVKYSGLGKLCKSVFLKFSHDPMHPQANHYDAIVNVKEAAPYNLNLLSSISSQHSKTTAIVSATGEDVPQDQPLDLSSKGDTVTEVIHERNEVIDFTDIKTNHEITLSQIKNDIDFQVIADDIQVIQDDAVESKDICQQIGIEKHFPVHLFDNIQPQEVNKIPEHLEGLQLLQVKTNINT